MSDELSSPDAKWLRQGESGPVRVESYPTDTFEAKSATGSSERLICPSCQHTVVTSDLQSGSIRCDNCGNSFRLERVLFDSTIDEIRIVGRFQLLDRVGQGSFGAVWRARDTQLDRVVAVKIPHHHAIEAGVDAERLAREARVAAQLRHPGIVRLYEVLPVNGLPVLVSDFIEGITLKELLAIRRLTFRETAGLVAQVADALDHAHERGLVHRDIKPANIMMEYSAEAAMDVKTADAAEGERGATRLGKPILVDFGLAVRPDAEAVMTIDGQIVGTPAYMSPEQAAGKAHHVDRRSDIYSLGVVLYQLLCGELPFRGSKVMLIHQLLHEDPRPPRRLNDRIPRDLDTICLKALAKLPSRRYATAAEIAEDLRRYLRGEPCQARPVGQFERAWLWARRNRGVAAWSGIAVILLVAVAVGSLLSLVREKKHASELGVALDKSNYLLAANYLDRGQSLCEVGEVAQGMLLIARGLSAVPEHAPDLARVMRANLAGWQERLDPLVALWADGPLGVTPRTRDAAAYSPDGKLLAIEVGDRIFQLRNGEDGKPIGEPINCFSEVRSLVFNPLGQTLAIACRDGKARFFDVAHGSFISGRFDKLERVYSLAYSHDGNFLATGGEDGQLKFWDAADGRQLLAVPVSKRMIVKVSLAPNDETVVTFTDDGHIDRWNVKDGANLARASRESYQSAARSPDGRWLATGDFDHRARIWDAASLKLRHSLEIQSRPVAVVFSPDSKILFTGSADKIARFWDIERGECIGSSAYQSQLVFTPIFSPDGKHVLTCGRDGVCQLRENRQPRLRCLEIPLTETVGVVAISPDGRVALTGTKQFNKRTGEIELWDLFTGKPMGRVAHSGNVMAAIFSPDGRTVATASADQTANLLDVATGKLLCPGIRHEGWVHSVAFSPDGKRLMTGCEDTFARLWEVPTGRYLDRRFQHADGITSVAFSPSGELALSASADHTAALWEISSGRRLHVFRHRSLIRQAVFSPDGRAVLTASNDRTARLWDVSSGSPLGKPLAHQDEVLCAAFSPDGKWVVTGSADQTAQLWSVSTTDPLGPPLPHSGPVLDVAFAPDGVTVATASVDATCRLWDVATCRRMGPALRHIGSVESLAFSPDGRRLITAAGNTARIWELPPTVQATPQRLSLWVETLSGLQLAANDALGLLSPAEWQQRRRDLNGLGGPPVGD